MVGWRTRGLPESKPHCIPAEVIVTWIPDWDKSRKLVSTAIYVKGKRITTEDVDCNDNMCEKMDYCEEEDAFWIPEGWYTSTIDCTGYATIGGKVIAWREMPKPYEQEDERRLKCITQTRKKS